MLLVRLWIVGVGNNKMENIKYWIDKRIEESVRFLDDNGTCYNDVIENKDSSEESKNNNFEAGIISGLLELKKAFNIK